MWKKIYTKGEANPEKSLIGCFLAYALMVVLVAVVMYFVGMQFRWFE
jgi:hypothetical protein